MQMQGEVCLVRPCESEAEPTGGLHFWALTMQQQGPVRLACR